MGHQVHLGRRAPAAKPLVSIRSAVAGILAPVEARPSAFEREAECARSLRVAAEKVDRALAAHVAAGPAHAAKAAEALPGLLTKFSSAAQSLALADSLEISAEVSTTHRPAAMAALKSCQDDAANWSALSATLAVHHTR